MAVRVLISPSGLRIFIGVGSPGRWEILDDISPANKQVSEEWFAVNVKEPLTAIQYGIGFEKDAILFFNELMTYMMPPHKEKIGELVEEEKKHLIYLSELKKKYIK